MATRKKELEPADLGPDDGSVGFAPERDGFGGIEPPRPDAAIHREVELTDGSEIVVRNGEVRLAGVVPSAPCPVCGSVTTDSG